MSDFLYLEQNPIKIQIFIDFKKMGNKPHQGVKERTITKRDKVLKAQIEQLNKVKKELKLSDEKMREVSDMTVTQAVHKLNSGAVNSRELVVALCLRTAQIGEKLCLFTETMFEPALKAAEQCDKNRKGKKNWTFEDGEFDQSQFLPPLYGIPMSIKDTYDMKGYTSSLGLLSRAEKEFQTSPLIGAMQKSGIIPFVRTNIPQFGMSPESMNDLWGRSLNPWNQLRSPGGSSGGQAGLISSKCSFMGLGSDIGGSIRIPAQFCGLFGLKCTAKRFSSHYHTAFGTTFAGSGAVVPLCIGPLSKSANDIALWMKIATTPSYYERMDPYIKNIEFDNKAYIQACKPKKKLRIGVIKRFLDIEPTKASARALEQAIKILEKDGHEVVEIKVPNERECIREFFRENLGTQCIHYRKILDGQQPVKEYANLFKAGEMWSATRSVASFGASKLMPRLHYYLFEKGQPMSGYDYQTHAGEIVEYRKQWADYWFDQKLDYAMTVGFGSQAFLHGNSEYTSLSASYTFIWNILEMCVGSVPVTVVREDEQEYVTEFDDLCATHLKRNAQNSIGLPVGIQVLGLPFEEERVLGLMSYLEERVKFYEKNPLPNL